MKIARVLICLLGLMVGGFLLTLPYPAWSQSPLPGKPAIYEFGRQTCPVCQKMAGVLKDVEAKYPSQFSIRFLYIETEEPIFKQYGVSFIPTQVFLDASGREVFRHVGPLSPEKLVNKLKELGYIKE